MRFNTAWLLMAVGLWLAVPPSAGARSFVLDEGSYRLGDGGFVPGSGGPVHPRYSITFHLVHPSRLRIVLGDVRPIDSPVSGFRLIGGMMTFGAGFFDMGNFGAEIKVSRLLKHSPGPVVLRSILTFPPRGGPYRSVWSPKLPAGDYLLTLRANFHEILADFDDFSFTGVKVEVEEPIAKVAPLGTSLVHTASFRTTAPSHASMGTHRNMGVHGSFRAHGNMGISGNTEEAVLLRQRAENAMVMELVEAKTKILALELEVQQLRDALQRTGVGFKPPQQ